MEFRQYLLDAFRFNDGANRKIIRKIGVLPDPAEGIRYMSHLINSQNKWMARIRQDPGLKKMSWWEPLYPLEELEPQWSGSLTPWLEYIAALPEKDLHEEITYTGNDNGRWAARPADIALQLIYHSIHHRAQIQKIIRNQGVEPDFIDYIGTKFRKLSD
jgi:uncharacterized damage-inducible protein DinB